MPVQIEWYIPNHVLIAHYYGLVTREDISYQYAEGIKLCHSVETPLVHILVDISGVSSFPKSMSDYKGTFGEKARNAGWVVLVGDNKIMRLLSSIVSNLMKLRFAYVNTMAEGLDYIAQRDTTVNIEQAPLIQS